jgi:trigger factor
LKIEKQFTEDHQVKLRVEADPEQLEQAKRRAAREIAKKTKIPGFRPGKAPYNIIERTVGEEAIFEDAMEHLVNDLYPKAITEAEIQPYGPGQLENIPSRDPLVFEFIVPLKAEVELGDYRSVSVPYELEPLEEAEVERVMQNLRQQQATLEPVERAAEVSDEVSIRISGERKNPDNEEWVQLIREMPAPVVIEAEEEDTEKEWPFPGFSQNLIGMTVNDEKELTYSYPEDAQYETLRGADARFHIKVEGVKARTLPELTDEFAVSFSEFETLDALRAEVRKRLEERAKEEYDQGYNDLVMEQLLERAAVKYPPQMVDDEIDSMIHDLEHRLGDQQLDIDTYLKSREMDRDALRKELEPAAENRLKRLLILFEVGQKEDIEVKNEDVQAATINMLSQMYNRMPPEQAQKQMTREYISNLTSSVTADLLVQNTLRRLRSIASGLPEELPVVAGGEAETDIEGGEAEAEVESDPTETEAEAGETAENQADSEEETSQEVEE